MDVDIVDLRRTRDDGLLEQAYRELYLACFTNPDEQEDLEQYRDRLFGQQQDPPQPVTHFLVAGENLDDPANRRIIGLLIFELYRESRCGLLTYIAVDPNHRERKLGRRLMAKAIEILHKDCGEVDRLQGLFGEVHNPKEVDGAKDAMPPQKRIEVMTKYGGRMVPIKYVQPELGEGKQPSRDLLLVAFPVTTGGIHEVNGRVLLSFLNEFYRALTPADPAENDDFRLMQADVHASIRGQGSPELEALARDLNFPLARLTTDDESLWIRVDEADGVHWNPEPHADSPKRIGFPRIPVFSVAMHFVFDDFAQEREAAARTESLSALAPSSDEFRSFEEDLISYAFLHRGLSRSSSIRLTDESNQLSATLLLPRPIRYRAEGQKKELLIGQPRRNAEQRAIDVTLRASVTEFRSGIRVLHLVISEREGKCAESSTLNEHDIVALSQLWHRRAVVRRDGSSPTPADPFATDLAAAIRFRAAIAGVEREYTVMDLRDMLKARLRNPSRTAAVQAPSPAPQCPSDGPRAGTIHVLLEQGAPSVESCAPQNAKRGLAVHPSLFSRLEDYRRKSNSPADDATDRLDRECIALQGLLCGLLDHWDIAEDELEDVFKKSVDMTGSTYVNVHKGTLISFGDDDRFNTNPAYDRLGMSPYLLLPQSVLLHNERLLERADAAAALTSDSQAASTAGTQRAAADANRAARKPTQKELYEAELKMRAALQKDWIPNLFHYSLEREIYDQGESGRGLAAWKGSLIERLEELNGQLDEVKAENANFINFTIGFIGFSLALAQVAGGWESIARSLLRLGGYSIENINPDNSSVYWLFAALGDLAYIAVLVLISFYIVLFRKELGEGIRQLRERWPWAKPD